MDGGHLASGLGRDTQGTGLTAGNPAMCLVLPVLPQALGHLLAALPLQKAEQQQSCRCAKGRVRKCSACCCQALLPTWPRPGGPAGDSLAPVIHLRWLAGAAREPGWLQLFQDVCPEPVYHPGLQPLSESACLLPQKLAASPSLSHHSLARPVGCLWGGRPQGAASAARAARGGASVGWQHRSGR